LEWPDRGKEIVAPRTSSVLEKIPTFSERIDRDP